MFAIFNLESALVKAQLLFRFIEDWLPMQCVVTGKLQNKLIIVMQQRKGPFFTHLFISALWSPAGKGLTSWLSFVVYNCEFVTFPLVSWYLIVSIPDLCTLTNFL